MSCTGRLQSQATEQTWETEDDDMAEGDLGYGLGRRPGGTCKVRVSCPLTSRKNSDGKSVSPPPFPRKGEERSGTAFRYSRLQSLPAISPAEPGAPHHRRHRSDTDPHLELSNVELRQRLQETLEEVEILKTELEAFQRQLEGKEEALKILQSMAVFDKATSHTQAVLQKTLEHKRSLEKEVNALQWEIEFDHNRFKNIEESWIQKYDRLNCENAVIKETLKLKTEEVKTLKSENAILNQQYLEALAMLDIKQQKMAQETTCHDKSDPTDMSSLELQVLGACLCPGPGGNPCSCAKMAASSRKMLLQLRQELEDLQKSKEEAYIMADAFRIAFEQQLMRKNDQTLRLTQMDKICRKATKRINWRHLKENGLSSQRNKKTLGQKLFSLLPSDRSAEKNEDQENPQEVFKVLVDLLNDKEEALAHQRKVSYMLARALEDKDKDTTSKENGQKDPTKEDLLFKNPCQNTSKFSVLHKPVHSGAQNFNSMACICSVQHLCADQNCTRTLKRSCSLPSSIML